MVELLKEARSMPVLVLLWCLVSVMFVFYVVPRSFGFSQITVDGDKSDWLGVEPMVNDTGDRSFWSNDATDFRVLRGYDITECYVQTDRDWLYFLFSKKPGGSAGWQLYFDTDLENQTGFSLNGMSADYRFSEGMDQGVAEWIGNQWVRLNLSFESNPEALYGGSRTTDGLVADAFGSSGSPWNQSVEWLEGKIAFSILGNPTVLRLVFQVLPEQDAAPETGYIVVSVKEGLRFAASFTSSSTRLAYGQRAGPAFLLLNFGSTEIAVNSLDIVKPSTVTWISGETHWSGVVSTDQELVLSSAVEPLVYGWSTLNSVFTVANSLGDQIMNLSIPLSIVMAPTVSLAVDAPDTMTLGLDNVIDVMVVNHDPFTAPVNIEPGPNSYALFDKISLELSSLASVQLYVNVTLRNADLKKPSIVDPRSPGIETGMRLTSVYALGEVQATFESVVLDEQRFGLNVVGPEMRIANVTMRAIPSNQTQVAFITIENLGNRSIRLSVSLFLEPQDLVSIRDENPKDVVILPGNNATVSFEIKTLESTDFWGKLSITGDGNTIDDVFVESVWVEQPVSPLIYMLVAAFLVLLAVMLILNRRWIAGKLSSKRDQAQRF